MKASKMRKKIKKHNVVVNVNTDSGVEKLRIPLLTIADWANIEEQTGASVWRALMETTAVPEGTTPEDIERAQRETVLSVLKQLDYRVQLEMFYQALLKDDPDITRDDVDWIISYGLDQENYMQALMGLAYGVTSDLAGDESSEDKTAPFPEKSEADMALLDEKSTGRLSR